jgi:hypothetical protein
LHGSWETKVGRKKIDGSKNIFSGGVLPACALAFTPASFQESVIVTKKDAAGSSSTPAAGIRQSSFTDCTLQKILYARSNGTIIYTTKYNEYWKENIKLFQTQASHTLLWAIFQQDKG